MSTNKQALRERYSPQPVPKCHICCTEMTVQQMSASRITYGCTGATYDDTGCHYVAGRSIADDHYEQSRVTIVDVSDSDVLALLDELEARTASEALYKASLKQADAELEAAAKRIAELEVRKIKLPQRYSMLYRTEFDAPYDSHMAFKESDVIEALSAAGITVKGE